MKVAEKLIVAYASIFCFMTAYKEIAQEFPIFHDEIVRIRRTLLIGGFLFAIMTVLLIKYWGFA
jgi:uncharacterized membrane protein